MAGLFLPILCLEELEHSDGSIGPRKRGQYQLGEPLDVPNWWPCGGIRMVKNPSPIPMCCQVAAGGERSGVSVDYVDARGLRRDFGGRFSVVLIFCCSEKARKTDFMTLDKESMGLTNSQGLCFTC